MSSPLLPVLIFLIAAACCNGALRQSFSDLPRDSSFDFVVIGGGTAGSVVASRLSENPRFNILLIEAGPSNEGVIQSEIPFLLLDIPSEFDWNFTTVPQAAAAGRVIDYPRGHILGGTSSINAMYYTRGSSSDYDRFAKFTGDSGWSWNNIFKYILKTEKWVPPADNHNTAGQFNPVFHNLKGTGMTSVSLPGFPQGIDRRVVQTTSELADEFPFNLDMNSGNPLGLGWLQSTIGGGARSSSAIGYLTPSILSRKNLEVVLNTQVTRVLEVPSNDKSKSFRQVELSTGSKLVTVTARKEVILSAGTVNTPHVLLNSGIGDAAELRNIGIHAVLNLPSVGKNMSDHPMVTADYNVNSNDTFDDIRTNATLEAELITAWEASHTGPLVTIGTDHVSYSRIPENASIFSQFEDPASGKNSPHLEISIANGGVFVPGASGNQVSALLILVTPVSRGSITLKSNNPLDPPLIDPAFLSSEFDTFALKELIAASKRFFAAPVWKDYIVAPAGAFANTTTDEETTQFIVETVTPAFHPVGTASMSPKNANFGVVDPDLKLKGAAGLRVVDASVMPFVPAAHPQAAVYAIAERASDLIKADWE